MPTNYRQIFAIEKKQREQLLKLNPKLNDKSGIYFFLRTDENGFRFGYIGQSLHILSRCSSHMSGYQQHIDLSIKRHGLYDAEKNPYGWRLEFINFPESELDEKEKFYIRKYADAGYQLRNVSLGGQGENRSSGQIEEKKQSKGYRQGIVQGRLNLSRELSDIIDKHLEVRIKPEKANNKISIKQYDKFWELLGGKKE